jgi:alcohol dehydrogenase (NADP+)
MASATHQKLNTGASIPAIGFGTWQDKDDQEKAVSDALEAGYTHIDTAHVRQMSPHIGGSLTIIDLRNRAHGW